MRAQREVISTSLPIGTNPHARNARSDAALPGETWAHTSSPGGATARPARDQRPAGTAAAIGPVVQLDRELEPTGEAAAERQQPAVVAEHPHLATMGAGTLDAWVVVEIGPLGKSDRRAGRWPPARRRASRSSRRARPATAARRGACTRRSRRAPRASRSAGARSVSTYEWPVSSTTACVPSSSGGNTSTSAVGRRESSRGSRRQDRGERMRRHGRDPTVATLRPTSPPFCLLQMAEYAL